MTALRTPTSVEREPLAPLVEDMSAFIIAGAVSAQQEPGNPATEGRSPAQGVEDGVEAERLGFRRVWISERWDIKKADVILSAVAARTTRLGVGTAVISPTTRPVWATAAFAATMQCCFGDRFVLGLGRGDTGAFRGMGIPVPTYEGLTDYVGMFHRVWNGESVDYDGPAGRHTYPSFSGRYPGGAPEIWFGGYAFEKAAAAVAQAFDGVMLIPMMTPEAVGEAVQRIRTACERIDRDPATVRVCAPVVTAPELDDAEAAAITTGRLVTYLTYPGYGKTLAKANGWDKEPIERLCAHKQFQGLGVVADLVYQRHELLGPGEMIPTDWLRNCCAAGSVEDCVATLQAYRDAGVDEIATYGSTPGQNAALLGAWRDRRAAGTDTP
jgi:5,10-methylenetetrahydromethanopterin reductase